jgi:hypothetical protein
MTLLAFQTSIAELIGQVAQIAQAGCVPMAENAGDLLQKIQEQVDSLGLCCVIRTPALTFLEDSTVQVDSLIIGFAEQPLVNRSRANAISALDAASFASLALTTATAMSPVGPTHTAITTCTTTYNKISNTRNSYGRFPGCCSCACKLNNAIVTRLSNCDSGSATDILNTTSTSDRGSFRLWQQLWCNHRRNNCEYRCDEGGD